jgi:hypothetical protein
MSLEGAYIDFLSEIKNEIVKEVKLEVARRSQDPVLHVFDHENNKTKPPLPPGQPFPDKQSSKFLDDILGTWEGGKK